MENRIEIKNKTIKKCLMALVPVVISYVIAAINSKMTYYTVDDGYYQATMNGDLIGRPFPVALAINPILSYPVTFLYKTFPKVQWWYVYSNFIFIVGAFLIHFLILKISEKNALKPIVSFALIGIINCGFVIHNVSNIAFTVVPAVLGAGVVLLMFCTGKYYVEDKENKILAIALIAYFLIIIHRAQTGYAMACYFLLAYLYILVNRKKGLKDVLLRFLIAGMTILFIIVFTGIVDNKIKKKAFGKEYIENEGMPIPYIDFTDDTYEENKEIYDAVGWDEDIYMLVHSYCFMLDEVNKDNMDYILDNIEYKKLSLSKAKNNFFSKKDSQGVLVLWISSCLIAIIYIIGDFNRIDFIFYILNNFGMLLLMLYQLFTGRILYRSVVILVLPALLINVFLSCGKKIKGSFRLRIIKAVSCLLGIVCICFSLRFTFASELKDKKMEYVNNERDVYEYVMAQPDNAYIIPVYTVRSLSPENYDGKNHPTNLIRWGDNGYNSNLYKEQLRINGIKKLSGKVFSEDNVYFICNHNICEGAKIHNSTVFATFYRYLKKHFKVVGFVQVDKINDDIYVYDFVYKYNKEKYDRYLDIKKERAVRVK